jgi:hypothetical protein
LIPIPRDAIASRAWEIDRPTRFGIDGGDWGAVSCFSGFTNALAISATRSPPIQNHQWLQTGLGFERASGGGRNDDVTRAPCRYRPSAMGQATSEHELLERAVHRIADEARRVDGVVEEAYDVGFTGSDPLVVTVKTLRLELLQVKADLERELERVVRDSTRCGRTVHWVSGLGVRAGHWAHAEPAPPGEPSFAPSG